MVYRVNRGTGRARDVDRKDGLQWNTERIYILTPLRPFYLVSSCCRGTRLSWRATAHQPPHPTPCPVPIFSLQVLLDTRAVCKLAPSCSARLTMPLFSLSYHGKPGWLQQCIAVRGFFFFGFNNNSYKPISSMREPEATTILVETHVFEHPPATQCLRCFAVVLFVLLLSLEPG